MQLFYIYKITNLLNNLSYIGFTKNPKKRFTQHISSKTSAISLAIKEYCVDNFSFEIIYVSKEYDYTLRVMEAHFINFYKTFENGYNQTTGGEESKSYRSDVRKKISDSRKGQPSPRKGAKLSSETKEKISEGNKGKKVRLGAILSDETKEKIRIKNLGKKYTKETNKKKGRPGSSHSNFGKNFSNEMKEKISKGQQNRTDNQLVINGVTYRSKRQAREMLKVSYKTLEKLILNQ